MLVGAVVVLFVEDVVILVGFLEHQALDFRIWGWNEKFLFAGVKVVDHLLSFGNREIILEGLVFLLELVSN